jgi:predicted transcriptional regulator
MADATINLAFDDDMIMQIDYFADNESLTRTDLIYNSVKMYINRKQRLRELYAYGENIAAKNNFTEEDVMVEIKNYRKNKKSPTQGLNLSHKISTVPKRDSDVKK